MQPTQEHNERTALLVLWSQTLPSEQPGDIQDTLSKIQSWNRSGGLLRPIELTSLMIDACLDNRPTAIAPLVQAGVPLNAFVKGHSALAHAACFGSIAAMAELVRLGAQVDLGAWEVASACGETRFNAALGLGAHSPMTASIEGGKLGSTGFLLAHGANPNKPDNFGRTPLHYAAQHGNTDAIALLLSYGANPGVACTSGLTPLMEAARRSQVDALIALFNAAPHLLEIRDDRGQTAFHHAATAEPIKKTWYGIHPTFDIAGDALIHLALYGADRHATTNNGKTPLELAQTHFRDFNAVEFFAMIERDALTINTPPSTSSTSPMRL